MVMSCYNGVAFNVVLRQSFVLMAHCELTRNVQTKVAQSIADTKLAPANQIWFLKIDNSSRFVRMLAGIRKIAGPFNVHTTHTYAVHAVDCEPWNPDEAAGYSLRTYVLYLVKSVSGINDSGVWGK